MNVRRDRHQWTGMSAVDMRIGPPANVGPNSALIDRPTHPKWPRRRLKGLFLSHAKNMVLYFDT